MTTGAEGLVLAGGRGSRLGQGPKAVLRLAGETLVERSVQALRPLCERVLVAAPEQHVAEVERLIGSSTVTVIAAGATRMDTARRLVEQANAEWLLITDVAHPFIDVELAESVLTAARRDGAAYAALANTDHVFDPAARRTFDAGTLLTLQKPIGCRAEALRTALEADTEAVGVLQALEGSGQASTAVPGKPTNVKITDADDWELAQAIATGRGRPAPRPPGSR